MMEVTVLERGAVRTLRLDPGAFEAFKDQVAGVGGTILSARAVRSGLSLTRRADPGAWAPWFMALARTLKGGVPLDKALDLLYEAAPMPDRIRRVHRAVVGGQRLSEAVATHVEGLPSLIPAMLRSGEAAGDLARGVKQAHQALQDQESFRRELRARLAYPMVVVAASSIAMCVLLLKVFPALSGMWTNMGKPLPTKLEVIRVAGWCGVLGLVILAGGLAWLMSGGEGAYAIPGFRGLGRHRRMGEAWSALAMALQGGVPLLDALALLGQRWEAQHLRDEIQRGERPDQVLLAWVEDSPAQRAVLLASLRIGNLPEGAASVAEGYRELLDQDLKGLQRWLEPAILLLLGSILMSLAWGLFSLMGEMEHGLIG